jgi:hypothetical protein
VADKSNEDRLNPPIDTSGFPRGAPDLDYESDDEREALLKLEDDALAYVESFRGSPPVGDIVLAFGLAPIIALFLVRFTTAIISGECEGETEMWVVVGDLPSMCFEPDMRTPADALRLYCAIAQDWADRVLAGEDLSESYPIPVEPTREHAKMLLSRISTLRRDFIPLAELPPAR